MANIEERVETLISKTINNMGYELYDVIYEKEAQDYYLRIFIDKPNGISLDDCEKVSDGINDILDEADYIKEQYFLEVSSPGVERVLRKDKHLQDSIGKEITCNLFSPIIINHIELQNDANKMPNNEPKEAIKNKKKLNSSKQIEGTLQSFDKAQIVLQVQLANKQLPTEVKLERKNIANIKLKYNWE